MMLKATEFLSDVLATRTPAQFDAVYKELMDDRDRLVASADEQKLNQNWYLRQVLSAQLHYLDAYSKNVRGEHYAAWCSLERVEQSVVRLRRLREHSPEADNDLHVDFMLTHTRRWQHIYPYSVFASPEFVRTGLSCSICGQRVNPRKPCGHRVGELYSGTLCNHEAAGIEFQGVSLVTHPVQKYSVLFSQDEFGKQVDHYDYSLVRRLTEVLRRPFSRFHFEFSTRLHPHASYKYVGRNDECPCGSGVKYKKCCLRKDGIPRPHVDFVGDIVADPDRIIFPTPKPPKRRHPNDNMFSVTVARADPDKF
jgi:hypothetical protein